MALGLPEILVIGSVAVLMFGAKRWPDIFINLGKSIKSFKSGMHEDEEQRKIRDVNEIEMEPTPPKGTKNPRNLG